MTTTPPQETVVRRTIVRIIRDAALLLLALGIAPLLFTLIVLLAIVGMALLGTGAGIAISGLIALAGAFMLGIVLISCLTIVFAPDRAESARRRLQAEQADAFTYPREAH